ncbi:MAG: ACP S-malonyltransferase [Nitrospirales bacterium]
MTPVFGFLFPGQGSQSVGMGKLLFESRPTIQALYKKATDILGYDVGALCFEGPSEQLNRTEYTQPALLVTSLAAFELVKDGPLIPVAVAGHSLGEYIALVAAGALGFEEAARLVTSNAGCVYSVRLSCCQEAGTVGIVAPANFNSPGQTVIAGEKAAVERAADLAKVRGAKRVKTLPVSVPVHTPLMQVAADRLKKDIDSLQWSDLKVPLVNNVDAKALYSAEDVRGSLVRQLPSPVLWQETIQAMSQMGITHFVEIGPGKVLTGLVKRIVPEAITWNVMDQESYATVLAHCS